jgi:hypothetical protein
VRAINITVLVTDSEYEKMTKKTEGVWKAPEHQLANTVMCILITEHKMNPDRVTHTSVNIPMEIKL